METPKVKFIDISLAREVDWIHGFLFQNKWGWGKRIIKKHPSVKKVLSLKTETEQVKFLKGYVVEFSKENQEILGKNKIKYREEWQKIEKEFFIALSETMQTDWPKNRKTIKAMFSINPICPRFLDGWSFSLFCRYKKVAHAIEVIMHESCHFLYFEKWQAVFPKSNPKTFEYPHLEWHLSEILAPVILGDPRIQKILKKKPTFYEEHKKLKINSMSTPDYFKALYNKHLKNQSSFSDFLKDAYREVKKIKKELSAL